MRNSLVLGALLALSACGSDDSGAEAGGMTPVEARALEDAAQMLDEKRLSEDLLRPPGNQSAESKKDMAGKP